MSLAAIVLLLISAFIHAGWNFLGKRQHPTAGFFLIANAFGTACVLPVLFYDWGELVLIPPAVWILSVVGGFFYFLFCAALAEAYRAGDLSIAYPLSLSSPVVLVTLFTLVIGRGGEIVGWALIGLVTVAAGCFILPMTQFGEVQLRNYLNACCLFGVLAGVGIAGMTIADYEALSILHDLPGKPLGPIDGPLLYMLFEAVIGGVWLGVLILAKKWERQRFSHTFRLSKLPAALTGAGMFLSYAFVLVAMPYVTNVSFVAAFRQLSIPLGATLGILFLKEPPYLPKLVGIAAVYGGLVLIGAG